MAAKSGMGLDRITSRTPHIVQALLRAALLRTTLAMQAKIQAERHLPKGRWINPLQWVKVWRERIGDLLGGWLMGRQAGTGISWERLARLAMDPNRKRRSPRVVARMGIGLEWGWHRHVAR